MRFSEIGSWLGIATSSVQLPISTSETGCGINRPPGFSDDPSTQYVRSGGHKRTYAVNVPDLYNLTNNTPWPLIIDYHGNKGTPAGQYDNSRYYAYTAGQQYLVVYPAGWRGHWQGPTYADPEIDDLQFTADLLTHLNEKYCIDPNRIYASGKSNGGGFVGTLACSNTGDSFAAFAMAAAALYTDTSEGDCPKQRAILETHGDRDCTIPYTGTDTGNGGPLPNITKWVQWWGQRDGCDPIQDRRETGNLGGYNITSYSCSGYTNVVQHYQTFDLGHCWPDSQGLNTDSQRDYCSCSTCHVLDYTPVVLNFFGQWNLSNAPKNMQDRAELEL